MSGLNKRSAEHLAQEVFLLEGSRKGGHYFHGNSMLPLFREGDRLLIEPTSKDELQIGDIIVFRNGENFPTRRIVRKLQEHTLVVGDNWIYLRQNVPYPQILGRVTARYRKTQSLTAMQLQWKLHTLLCLLRFNFREPVHLTLNRVVRRLSGLIRNVFGIT